METSTLTSPSPVLTTDAEIIALVKNAVREVVEESKAVPRVAYSPREAAEALGCSRNYFDAQVLPRLAIRRVGGRIFVPVRELERFLIS